MTEQTTPNHDSERTAHIMCQFATGTGEGVGAAGEVNHGDGGVFCTTTADDILRPRDGQQMAAFGHRATFCRRHATYLVEEAPTNWEMLSFDDLSKLRNIPEETPTVFVTGSGTAYHDSEDCPSSDDIRPIPKAHAEKHWDQCNTCIGNNQ